MLHEMRIFLCKLFTCNTWNDCLPHSLSSLPVQEKASTNSSTVDTFIEKISILGSTFFSIGILFCFLNLLMEMKVWKGFALTKVDLLAVKYGRKVDSSSE